MGYVYLLLEVNKDGNERHKIGFSKHHPDKRVKQLQTGNSNIISVLNFYETPNHQKMEKLLHRKFASQRTETENEWFSLTDEQVTSFMETCKETDDLIKFMLQNNPFYK